MTREDMVCLIEEYLLHEFYMGVPIDSNRAWDSYTSASNILDVVEGAGMLPPYSGKFTQVNITDRWGQDTGEVGYGRIIQNEWEKE